MEEKFLTAILLYMIIFQKKRSGCLFEESPVNWPGRNIGDQHSIFTGLLSKIKLGLPGMVLKQIFNNQFEQAGWISEIPANLLS